jgi:leucyl aminopeptidase (aminopeptidase T)
MKLVVNDDVVINKINLSNVNENRIYAFYAQGSKEIFKLTCLIYPEKYTWVSLENTVSRWIDNLQYNSITSAIKDIMGENIDVYEFIDFKEFKEWLNKIK